MKENFKNNIERLSQLALNQIKILKEQYKLESETLLVLENCKDIINTLLELKKEDKVLINCLMNEIDEEWYNWVNNRL